MQIRTIQPCFLIALALLCGNAARADYLNWTYTSNPNVPGISAGALSPNGGALVTLTNFSAPQAGALSIPVIAYVTATSSTTSINFGPSANSPSTYSLALTITDGTTHDSGTLNFTGSLAGPLTATTSGVVNRLTPVSSSALTLDGHKYTVSIPSVTLASPTSPQQNILASVSVSNATGPSVVVPQAVAVVPPSTTNTPTNTPEPGSIILACLGIAFLGTSGVRRSLQRSAVG
jgi:hypothetical protein